MNVFFDLTSFLFVYLSLDTNKLNGEIPDGIGLLTDLDVLLLNNNELNGAIPGNFSMLSNLCKFNRPPQSQRILSITQRS